MTKFTFLMFLGTSLFMQLFLTSNYDMSAYIKGGKIATKHPLLVEESCFRLSGDKFVKVENGTLDLSVKHYNGSAKMDILIDPDPSVIMDHKYFSVAKRRRLDIVPLRDYGVGNLSDISATVPPGSGFNNSATNFSLMITNANLETSYIQTTDPDLVSGIVNKIGNGQDIYLLVSPIGKVHKIEHRAPRNMASLRFPCNLDLNVVDSLSISNPRVSNPNKSKVL